MRYSLANYILSLESNDPVIKNMFGTISIGGQGNAVGQISLSRASDLFTTTGYATGAWVHNKNLDRHGTASIQLNQLSNEVAKFIQLANLFYLNDYDGFTITVSNIDGMKVAEGIDCYFNKIADQNFAESAEDQTWILTCGQINYN